MVAKNLKDYCKKNNIEFEEACTFSYDKEGEKLFFEKANLILSNKVSNCTLISLSSLIQNILQQ